MIHRIDIEESKLSKEQKLIEELNTKDHQEYNHVGMISLVIDSSIFKSKLRLRVWISIVTRKKWRLDCCLF